MAKWRNITFRDGLLIILMIHWISSFMECGHLYWNWRDVFSTIIQSRDRSDWSFRYHSQVCTDSVYTPFCDWWIWLNSMAWIQNVEEPLPYFWLSLFYIAILFYLHWWSVRYFCLFHEQHTGYMVVYGDWSSAKRIRAATDSCFGMFLFSVIRHCGCILLWWQAWRSLMMWEVLFIHSHHDSMRMTDFRSAF